MTRTYLDVSVRNIVSSRLQNNILIISMYFSLLYSDIIIILIYRCAIQQYDIEMKKYIEVL